MGCVSAPESVPVSALLADLHVAASAPSACATSEMMFGTCWWDSKLLPAAQPGLSLSAEEGAVSLRLQGLRLLWR